MSGDWNIRTKWIKLYFKEMRKIFMGRRIYAIFIMHFKLCIAGISNIRVLKRVLSDWINTLFCFGKEKLPFDYLSLVLTIFEVNQF